jgi:O-6-methylguanine DNA methyltransferase
MLEIAVRQKGDVWFGVACEGQKVYASSFAGTEEETVRDLVRIIQAGVPFQKAANPSTFAINALLTMEHVHAGRDCAVDLPLALERFPKYTQRVLRTVAAIPVGYVSSYGWVAEAAGGGARAVGNAMATNKFAPLVPCHRVVTSSLGLGGYGGGLKVKLEFLKREKRGFTEPMQIVVEWGNLRVFPVERVLEKLEHNLAWQRR